MYCFKCAVGLISIVKGFWMLQFGHTIHLWLNKIGLIYVPTLCLRSSQGLVRIYIFYFIIIIISPLSICVLLSCNVITALCLHLYQTSSQYSLLFPQSNDLFLNFSFFFIRTWNGYFMSSCFFLSSIIHSMLFYFLVSSILHP